MFPAVIAAGSLNRTFAPNRCIGTLVMWISVCTRSIVIAGLLCLSGFATAGELFEIQVVDKETRRGIPMVELTTVDDVVYITDSAGRIAFHEPELTGSTVFFRVVSPGYHVEKDGFGIEGIRLVVEPGGVKIIEMTRTNLAERLYRITGRDIYRDTVRLGHTAPIKNPVIAGKVVGQDSIQPVFYNDKIYWFWGDTNQLQYPLGLFRMAGAVSALPTRGGLDPSVGINLDYFTKADGFARAMVEVPNPEGVVWIHGVCTVTDENGDDRIVGQYSRRRGLSEALEQGLVLWNDDRAMFEVLTVIDLDETWRMLRDHPIRTEENGQVYLCFGNPFPVTRVPATLTAIQDPGAYESWTCRSSPEETQNTIEQSTNADPLRDESGTLVWNWRKAPPVTQQDEHRWLKAGKIHVDEARYLPRDANGVDRIVEMHSGTVHWNEFRKRWIMIAIEHAWDRNSPSLLGEVFYSEAETPQGPFLRAVKVATHPKQSFYNPCHHPFFDQEGGRLIYFEGTYCNTFTNSPATPRYNYNQMMYRLDLENPEVKKISE
jgi:hypothetical protein